MREKSSLQKKKEGKGGKTQGDTVETETHRETEAKFLKKGRKEGQQMWGKRRKEEKLPKKGDKQKGLGNGRKPKTRFRDGAVETKRQRQQRTGQSRDGKRWNQ